MYYLGDRPQLHRSLLVDAQEKWEGFLRTSATLEDEEIKTLLKKKGGKKTVEFYEKDQSLSA